MSSNQSVATKKRTYNRRSAEERIAELEKQITEQKERLERKKDLERKKREVNPAVKRIPKLARVLQAYSQFAMDNGRVDLSNMVTMFLVGLQRIHMEESAAADEAAGVGAEDEGVEPGDLFGDF